MDKTTDNQAIPGQTKPFEYASEATGANSSTQQESQSHKLIRGQTLSDVNHGTRHNHSTLSDMSNRIGRTRRFSFEEDDEIVSPDMGEAGGMPDLFFHPGLSSRSPPSRPMGTSYLHSTATWPVLSSNRLPVTETDRVVVPNASTLDRNISTSTYASYQTAPSSRNLSTYSNNSYTAASVLKGRSNASSRSHATFTSSREWLGSTRSPVSPHSRPTREENPSFIKSKLSADSTARASTSEWLSHLQKKGILLDDLKALDWSGKGQHVEYGIDEEALVPLKVERTIGHSATALVEAVRCRRIRLARKRIRCNRRITPYDAIVEVQHLQRLQHYHLVRVVGTYIIRKDLSILLYPVTEWNLEEFMEDTVDRLCDLKDFSDSYEHRCRTLSLRTFFGCISNALHYIHRMNVKHMDIKPKNFLVRSTRTPLADRVDNYKIYIADFGIARSYNSAQEAETDSWTSFTRTYAAPEVVLQEKRSFSADIFSLGCVFTEILATILSTKSNNLRAELQENRVSPHGDTSFQANVDTVRKFILRADKRDFFNDPRHAHARKAYLSLVEKMPYCLDTIPALRPNAEDMAICTKPMRCLSCESGPEPFEAAEPLQVNT
jgi:tRNA A-37 threonylcarbamoyl transferase component Bud32